MKTVAQISQEITTTIREMGNGGFEIVSTHISGETKRGNSQESLLKIKADLIHRTLVNRIARSIETF